MSVGVARDALYIVAPSVVRFLFPTIQLPWTSIASAKPFEAPGWVEPIGTSETAIQIQAEYDPGFRGEFIKARNDRAENMHPAADVCDRGRAQLFAAELMDASESKCQLQVQRRYRKSFFETRPYQYLIEEADFSVTHCLARF